MSGVGLRVHPNPGRKDSYEVGLLAHLFFGSDGDQAVRLVGAAGLTATSRHAWAIRTPKRERPAERGVLVTLASPVVLIRSEMPGLSVCLKTAGDPAIPAAPLLRCRDFDLHFGVFDQHGVLVAHAEILVEDHCAGKTIYCCT